MNPSDDYLNGFPTIAAGIFVPSGAVTSNAYDVNRIVNAFWTGARYSLWSNLDLAAGVYYRIQNDYLPAPSVCTGSGTTISSHKCAGSDGAVSFLIDYKPVKRVDLYGGVMLSNVWGGFAFGHLYTQNVDPTIGPPNRILTSFQSNTRLLAKIQSAATKCRRPASVDADQRPSSRTTF